MYEVKNKKTAIYRFETLPSTSDYVKEKRADGQNLIVVAKSQTSGHGTKGRSFSSTLGGLYMSVLSFPKKLPAKHAFRIMQTTATAVCETLRTFGIHAKIKWPNDVLVNGKKICGILIENTFLGGFVQSSVVGIGINVFNALPNELKEIAITIEEATGKKIDVERVEEILLEKLYKRGIWRKYPRYVGFIGEEITLLCGENEIFAKMLGVDSEGNLLAETEKGRERFSSAEVSLRGKK